MGAGTLTIFNASAGSGKTFSLAGIYLGRLFESRYSYRRILAVTFTNKATAEMKNRILDHLNNLATGKPSEYLEELETKTGKKEDWIRNEAGEIINAILHDFSRFSVSTIDSFFQKILRAFTREIGLGTGFSIEIDHSTILSLAIDQMIASASDNNQLRNWLTDFVRSNIEDEKGWNLKTEIKKLAEELFNENFKTLSASDREKIEDKEYLSGFIREIKTLTSSFEKQLISYGQQCSAIYSEYGLSEDMFFQRGKGIPSFIRSLSSGDTRGPNTYVRRIEEDPPKWSSGTINPALGMAVKSGLDKNLKDAIKFYDNNILNYRSAGAVISNIYSLGILSDVLRKIHDITTGENSFLLSDAGELIYRIIGNDQAPFIYEKTGNRFETFMIDEFQDTSLIQWNNFKALILNSISEGFDNLVVGDIKQSIYRWRNSDWRILAGLLKQVDQKRVLSVDLTTNYRSRSNIIMFNNALFSKIPKQIDEDLTGSLGDLSFTELFSTVKQEDPGRCFGGYVKLQFVEDQEEAKWDEQVLQEIPSFIEKIQDKGFKASDIGIIVRDNHQGASVLSSVINYSNKCDHEKKARYNYNIVSNDSLLLSNSSVVNFLISAYSVLNDPDDMISRAVMLRSYLLTTGHEDPMQVNLMAGNIIEFSQQFFPEGYVASFDSLLHLPLFEITERLISFFGLGNISTNVAYLSSFQDLVINFSKNKDSDLQSFIDWWSTDGRKKSVVLSDRQDAVRVLTIHKSKGLEFSVVILPFLSWSMDHKSLNQPTLWVKPGTAPFNRIGIAPVKYQKDLSETIFAEDYMREKYSSYLDNLNLLYVALTRAKDVIYAFAPMKPKGDNTIASYLLKAVVHSPEESVKGRLSLPRFFNTESAVFEFGEIPLTEREETNDDSIIFKEYIVTDEMDSLRLKLHGENYFSQSRSGVREKINYGKLMHEIFQEIITAEDIPSLIRKLLVEGKIALNESAELEARLKVLLENPMVSDWFSSENRVMTEAGILLPSGEVRRPDRVIIKGDRTIIIDFKFGEENQHHLKQIGQYRQLLSDMGYKNIEAYLWYVDKNNVRTV